jgi:hypothetical protein
LRVRSAQVIRTAALLVSALVAITWFAPEAAADTITFQGTVSYQGSYSGDTLYVAVLDTMGTEDVTLLALETYEPGPPPFDQSYSLSFDNTGLTTDLLIASFLDVDGGGVDSLGTADVFGWYAGGTRPAGVSPASSATGLDFDLPRAEIHGTLTFDSGQTQARVNLSPDDCMTEGFRPFEWTGTPGPYDIIGVYPGTYCVNAVGGSMGSNYQVCYGDATCSNPTLITLSETQVVTGVDLDFSAGAPVERTTWGGIKARYP